MGRRRRRRPSCCDLTVSCISSKSLARKVHSIYHMPAACSCLRSILRSAASISSFRLLRSSFWSELKASCILTFLSRDQQARLSIKAAARKDLLVVARPQILDIRSMLLHHLESESDSAQK